MEKVLEHVNDWVPGLRAYEPGRPLDEVAREFGFDPDTAIKLASNENALGPSPLAVAAMQDQAARMHLYPDGGAFHLRRAIAERLEVSADCLLMANGSNEVIELLSHVFLQPGRNIVMGAQAFVIYRLCAAVAQAEAIAVPMPAHLHDLPAMVASVDQGTRLFYVANPNNPTGTMVDGEALDRALDALPADVLFVIDEAYVELLPPERQPDTLRYVREGRNVVLLRTFSKTYGLAGLRVGYAVAAPSLVSLLHRVRQPFNVNAMALAGAQAALADDAHVERTRELVAAGLTGLERAFDAMGLSWIPSVTNFVCVKTGDGRAVFNQLQARGIIVRPMDVYGLDEYIRVTVGVPEENARFLEVLKEIL